MSSNDTASAGTLQALSNNLASAVERAGAATVAINARRRIPSSGVIWRPGVIATAAHTIKREEEITVMLPSGLAVPARLAGRDNETDLALLKFDGAEAAAAETADASTLKAGHIVLSVGRISEQGPSASLGIISALGGPWRTWRGGYIDRYIRLDMGIYDGFSGSPLVDTQGKVIGINTSGLSRGGGLTIPASTVDRVIEELLTQTGGVIILSVEPEGPADRAGLLIGDVMVVLGDKPVADTDDVQGALGPKHAGETLSATLVRGGELIQAQIMLGERP